MLSFVKWFFVKNIKMQSAGKNKHKEKIKEKIKKMQTLAKMKIKTARLLCETEFLLLKYYIYIYNNI